MQMNSSLDSNGDDKSLYCVEKSQHTDAQYSNLSKNAQYKDIENLPPRQYK